MPELPEVETVKATLKQFLINEVIEDVDVYYDKIIQGDSHEFVSLVKNQRILDIDRYGKYLIFKLENIAFISHLRMEGKYHIVDKGEPVSKHTHVVFHLKDKDLHYIDTRKFGRMQIASLDQYRYEEPIVRLGQEPFDIDELELYKLLHKSSLPIKTALLDQSIMAGIGNIYANEICFQMGIDPRTKANRLSKKRVKELKEVSIEILNHAIECGGTTIHSFDSNGIHGRFQIDLNVHMKKECKVCHGDIKKIMLNQRGTYYCPNCQKRRY